VRLRGCRTRTLHCAGSTGMERGRGGTLPGCVRAGVHSVDRCLGSMRARENEREVVWEGKGWLLAWDKEVRA
jgi:hypothetical protein